MAGCLHCTLKGYWIDRDCPHLLTAAGTADEPRRGDTPLASPDSSGRTGKPAGAVGPLPIPPSTYLGWSPSVRIQVPRRECQICLRQLTKPEAVEVQAAIYCAPCLRVVRPDLIPLLHGVADQKEIR